MSKFENKLKNYILSEMKSPDNLETIKKNLVFNDECREKALHRGIVKELTKNRRLGWIVSGVLAVLLIFISIIFITSDKIKIPRYLGMEVVNQEKLKLSYSLEEPSKDKTEADYFANTDEWITIKIKFDNPDEYEILSFVLNDVKYQSYQFENNSTSENIYLRIKVPNTPGLYTYVIDRIKYINDTKISDVIISGDTSLVVAVAKNTLPVITYNVETFSTSMKFDFLVNDIEETSRKNCLLVMKDEELLFNEEISSSIEVSNLLPSTSYEIIIISYVSLLSETGEYIYEVSRETHETKPFFDVVDIESTNRSITFKYQNYFDDIIINDVEVYLNNTLFKKYNNVTYLDDLLSDKEYTIKIHYLDNYEYIFTCHTRASEEIIISNEVNAIEQKINYHVEICDEDNTLKSLKVRLYLVNENNNNYSNNNYIEKEELTGEFTDLLENKEYEIRVYYEYDLYDGNNIYQKTITSKINTSIKNLFITDQQILNDFIRSEDEVSVQFNFNASIRIKKIFINDQEYDNEKSTKDSSVLINFIPDYVDYLYEFMINRVIIDLNGENKEIELSKNYFGFIKVDNTIDILSVSNGNNNYVLITDDDLTSYEYYRMTLEIKIQNSIGGMITDVEFWFSDKSLTAYKNKLIEIIDDETLRISFDYLLNDIGAFYISRIFGIKDDKPYSVYYSLGGYTTFIPVKSLEAINISTKEDFEKIKSYYIYNITNDIDLTDSNWNPIEFKGEIKGNNHTIKNYTKTMNIVYDNTAYGGLFTKIICSRLSNINFDNIDMTYIYEALKESVYNQSYTGGLCGMSSDSIFDHVSFTGKYKVISKDIIYACGFCGFVNREIENRYNKVNLKIEITIVQLQNDFIKIYTGKLSNAHKTIYEKNIDELINKITFEVIQYE